MISNATYLLKLASKKEVNCNVMRSYNQSHDRSNLIKIILYLSKVDFSLVTRHLTYLIFLVNLLNQFFDQLT